MKTEIKFLYNNKKPIYMDIEFLDVGTLLEYEGIIYKVIKRNVNIKRSFTQEILINRAFKKRKRHAKRLVIN
jgi:hypothetical protein